MSTSTEIQNVGIVLLAAGSSSRLGKPKQLLNYDGDTLLHRAIKVAVAANASHLVVVLGAQAGDIQKQVPLPAGQFVVNDQFRDGMSGSIRCGLNELLVKVPRISAVVIMLCDQPFVTTSLLNDLITAHFETRKPVVACSYANTFGPPALFHKDLFRELMQLEGDSGARKVILDHSNDVATVSFEAAEIDIDTPADVQKLVDKTGQGFNSLT